MNNLDIPAGELIHRLRFYRQSATVDSLGQNSAGDTSFFTCWSRVEELSGTELEKARKLVPSATTQITMRYAPGIKATHQAVYTDPEGTAHTYSIGNVNDILYQQTKLVLTCSEIKRV